MKASQLRPLDVLKNTVNGELGLVIEIVKDKVCLADRTGQRALFKLGPLFVRVSDEQTGFALAALNAMRERRKLTAPKKRARRVVKS